MSSRSTSGRYPLGRAATSCCPLSHQLEVERAPSTTRVTTLPFQVCGTRSFLRYQEIAAGRKASPPLALSV